jgi:hypothetical protein
LAGRLLLPPSASLSLLLEEELPLLLEDELLLLLLLLLLLELPASSLPSAASWSAGSKQQVAGEAVSNVWAGSGRMRSPQPAPLADNSAQRRALHPCS